MLSRDSGRLDLDSTEVVLLLVVNVVRLICDADLPKLMFLCLLAILDTCYLFMMIMSDAF